MTPLNHLQNRKSAASPGFTAGLAVPIYNHTRNTAEMQAKAYTQFTNSITITFKPAPNKDSHLLHRCEYQFLVFECICGLGTIGVFSVLSSGLLVDPDVESA